MREQPRLAVPNGFCSPQAQVECNRIRMNSAVCILRGRILSNPAITQHLNQSSSPAGMGQFNQQLVFLLPGNPVSCLCAYDFFAGRAIRGMGGRMKDWPYRRTQATLTRKRNHSS